MATIDDLNTSILSMNHDDAFTLVKNLRLSRRTPKKVVKTRNTSSPRAANRVKPKQTPADIAKTLTVAQKAALLQMLTKEEK